MPDITELHNKAMGFAEEAVVARIRKEGPAIILGLLQMAYRYERESADLAAKMRNAEPSASILSRSADAIAKEIDSLTEEAGDDL